MKFKKAEREKVNARVALLGPAGSGKSYTALGLGQRIAKHFGGRMAVIDTEHESASIYADKFDFDVLTLDSFSIENYIEAINAAADAGYTVLVIDSLSHAWIGKDGLLEFVNAETTKSTSKNSFQAWNKATPKQLQMIETILKFPGHIIITMRVKMGYEIQEDSRGKKVPVKIGLQPVQRDGLEYEFTVTADMDLEHNLIVSKSRCDVVADKVYPKPGDNFAKPFIEWLEKGVDTTGRDEEAEVRKATALTINKTLAYCKTNKVSNMDVPNRHNAWVNKHLGCDLKDITDLDADKLKAALADLERKVAVHLLAQVLTLDAEIVELSEDAGAARKEIDGVYETVLVKLTGEDSSPTTDPKEASTRSLAKAVPVLTKYRHELQKEADKSGEAA